MSTGWLSAEQAGEYVHLSARTVKRYANRGAASRKIRLSP